MSQSRMFIVMAAFLFGGMRSGEAGINLQGTLTNSGFSYPDPAGSGYTISFRVSKITNAATPMAGDTFSTLFASQVPGWTLSYGGSLSGTLNVTTLSSFKNTNNNGSFSGSLRQTATYTPGANDPSGVTFIQYYTTQVTDNNGNNKYVQMIDDPIGQKSGLPTYYNTQLMMKEGLTFKDIPQDPMPSQSNAYQIFINNFTHTCVHLMQRRRR